MVKYIHKKYENHDNQIVEIINSFDEDGELIRDKRNKLKLYDFNGVTLNVKYFKIPNLVNKVVYKFFRKSKAQRSFEYADKLSDLGIGTPQPVAYFEYYKGFLFHKSFYVSEHIDYDLTYRELINDLEYPDHENILRAFTRFTYELHEKNIHFLDHSPGNTLIKKVGDAYQFFLVDLNRMEFRPLSFVERIKNFDRLSKHKSMVEVMSDEYAKCIGKPYEEVFDLMWKSIQSYQFKFHRKRRLKKKIFFWKS